MSSGDELDADEQNASRSHLVRMRFRVFIILIILVTACIVCAFAWHHRTNTPDGVLSFQSDSRQYKYKVISGSCDVSTSGSALLSRCRVTRLPSWGQCRIGFWIDPRLKECLADRTSANKESNRAPMVAASITQITDQLPRDEDVLWHWPGYVDAEWITLSVPENPSQVWCVSTRSFDSNSVLDNGGVLFDLVVEDCVSDVGQFGGFFVVAVDSE